MNKNKQFKQYYELHMKYNYNNIVCVAFLNTNNLIQSHLQEHNNNNDINLNMNSFNVSGGCEVTFTIMYFINY